MCSFCKFCVPKYEGSRHQPRSPTAASLGNRLLGLCCVCCCRRGYSSVCAHFKFISTRVLWNWEKNLNKWRKRTLSVLCCLPSPAPLYSVSWLALQETNTFKGPCNYSSHCKLIFLHGWPSKSVTVCIKLVNSANRAVKLHSLNDFVQDTLTCITPQNTSILHFPL